MTIAELIVLIGNNEAALSALPENLREAVLAAKKENEESARRLAEARERANSAAREKLAEEARIQHEKAEQKRRDLLCIGTWAEKIPRNRRFVLCEMTVKNFFGWCGQEQDPSKWEDVVVRCPVDIVRGYTSPYFGYFKYIGDNSAYKDRLQPVLEASTEAALLQQIRGKWDFFDIGPDGTCNLKSRFRILNYKVDAEGNVTITGRGEAKTLQEHRADLEKEFEKGIEP